MVSIREFAVLLVELKGHSGFGSSWRSLLNFHLQEEKVENTSSKEESSLVRLGLIFLVV